MQNRFAAALAVVAACASTGASALVIDFNEFATDGDQYSWIYDAYYTALSVPFTADGFVFSSFYTDGVEQTGNIFWVFDRDAAIQGDPGNATIATMIFPNIVTMSQVNGGTFDLSSIDMAEIGNYGASFQSVEFKFYHADGQVDSNIMQFDDTPGLQTFVFNQTDLISASWEIVNYAGWYDTFLQFDNIQVSTTPVPEPETYALMLAGLGLVFGASRRRT